jgi:hypothetical protein
MVGHEQGAGQPVPFAIGAIPRLLDRGHHLAQHEGTAHAHAMHEAAGQTGQEQHRGQSERHRCGSHETVAAHREKTGNDVHRRQWTMIFRGGD